MEMRFHSVAEIFPLLQGEEFTALVESIRSKGLLNPIWLHPDGRIVDGRNRYLACLEAGVEPRYQKWNGKGSLTDFVFAQNFDRRHLNATFRALAGKRAEPFYAEEAKQRQRAAGAHGKEGGRGKQKPLLKKLSKGKNKNLAADRAAKAAKTNRQYISDLKRIEKEAPEVYAQIEAGKLELPAAKRAVGRAEAERNLNSIAALEAKELAGLFDVVVIDPPWPVDMIERDCRPEQVSYDYPVMTIEQIGADVGKMLDEHAAEDAHIFLWVTQKFLPFAFKLSERWNLAYGEMFTWHKPGGFQPFGGPQYNSEHCIHARKGSPIFLDTKDFPTCFYADRAGHSEKPEAFYERLRRVTGGRRLDMYNRREIDGFEGWGKETPDLRPSAQVEKARDGKKTRPN
jgi:N6-adenosine-specific RNA methylase IME4